MPIAVARSPPGILGAVNYIFDFDGTIADSMVAFIAVFNKNVRGTNNPLTPEEIEKLRGMSSRRAIRHAGVRWWQVPKLILQGIPDFHALLPTLETFDGLPETLQKLHERGDKLFIVTSNTAMSVEEFLQRHKLNSYFTALDTGSGLFKKAKHIRSVIKEHGLKRRETVYVGDETRDIQAARLARVKIVSVAWGFNNRQALERRRPNFLIDEPKELLEIKL
jgi:phosphoglycolate phosphatase